MSLLPDPGPAHFRMRKSSAGSRCLLPADELAEAGQFEADIAATGEQLARVADELRRRRRLWVHSGYEKFRMRKSGAIGYRASGFRAAHRAIVGVSPLRSSIPCPTSIVRPCLRHRLPTPRDTVPAELTPCPCSVVRYDAMQKVSHAKVLWSLRGLLCGTCSARVNRTVRRPLRVRRISLRSTRRATVDPCSTAC